MPLAEKVGQHVDSKLSQRIGDAPRDRAGRHRRLWVELDHHDVVAHPHVTVAPNGPPGRRQTDCAVRSLRLAGLTGTPYGERAHAEGGLDKPLLAETAGMNSGGQR